MVQLIKFVLENSSPSEQESWKATGARMALNLVVQIRGVLKKYEGF